MKVTCFDDSNKPNEIPANKWVKYGEDYTVTGVIKCLAYGTVALILEEIDLSGCEPYKGFDSRRFGVSILDLDQLVKEESLELQEV